MPAPTSVFTPVATFLQQMIAQTQASGSKITDFSPGSGARTLYEAVAVALSSQSQTADQLNSDAYLDTATGDALDAKGADFFVARLPAVQATGTVSITRQQTGSSMLVPAGWGQVSTKPGPGQAPVAFVTTADASFGPADLAVTVPAQAVLGGASGNISAGTVLVPINPITGVLSDGGIVAASNFTGGVDAEGDDAYRARIATTVQGRVKGIAKAFEAGALGVPGVLSVGVLKAGDARGDGSTVPPGSVEVYYQGSPGLLPQVQSATDAAAVLNQNATAYASATLLAPRGALRVICSITVYALAGTDATALGAAISQAVIAMVNATGIGNTLFHSQVVEMIHSVPGVISVAVPLGDLRLSTVTPGTAGDIVAPGDSYVSLAAGDVSVVVNLLS